MSLQKHLAQLTLRSESEQHDLYLRDYGLRRGLEKESLRMHADGAGLAKTRHPAMLGASLTHPQITTDFSEGLLEFITPPLHSITDMLQQLLAQHQFVLGHIGNEWLWPASMPPTVLDPLDIQIANFGDSASGMKKRIYREGLALRYGKLMQIIAGIHFNFSLPETLMQQLSQLTGQDSDVLYMAQVRQLWRQMWIIPYLFGASSVAARTSVMGPLPACVHMHTQATVLAPYATSLRLGALGYHNKGCELINICYQDVRSYARSLQLATQTPYAVYQGFDMSATSYRQLNAHVLQIENELYAPVRPKQITHTDERPSHALCRRGVQYVELRALDINPLSPLGVEREQIALLDIFMLHSMLKVAPEFAEGELQRAADNIQLVANYGRKPNLVLQTATGSRGFNDMANELFAEFAMVADWLDAQHTGVDGAVVSGDNSYRAVVAAYAKKIQDPELTLSAQIQQAIVGGGCEYDDWIKQLAQQHASWLQNAAVDTEAQADLASLAEQSWLAFKALQ